MSSNQQQRSGASWRAELRQAAVAMARGAGRILAEAMGHERTVSHKGTVDLVTDADRAVEAFIVGEIRRAYPGHAIVAEETGHVRHDGPWRWVVDPLDGTTNFAHGLPHFAVLLAVQEQVAPGQYASRIAVTFDPVRDELFVASEGEGAELNGDAIGVSSTTQLLDGLVSTGFPYDRLSNEDDGHAEFCRLNLLTQGVRRCGSAGLDLAYVACGRFAGFWEYRLKPWDVAGGTLLVSEAGGRVTTLAGAPLDFASTTIVASNGRLHSDLLAALHTARTLPAGSRIGIAPG